MPPYVTSKTSTPPIHLAFIQRLIETHPNWTQQHLRPSQYPQLVHKPNISKMHSFRALARAAPRATARLTATSARASIRPAFTSSIKTQAPRALTAAFSTSRPAFDASAQELAAKLTSELQLESENADSSQTASDSNVQNFLSRTDWQLHDVDGEQIVKLSRKFEDELIEVRFTIADFNNPYPEEDADEALYDEEMELGDAQSGGANTKGAINQGNSRDGNFKVAPEDNIAPGDREGLADEEVRNLQDD